MLKTILPLLLFAGLSLAQDNTDCSSCGGCSSKADPAKVLVADLTAARKDLSDARLEEAKLPAAKLAAVRRARAHLLEETAVGKATVSTMVVNTLRLEEAAKSEKKSSELVGEMAKSCRAVVLSLDANAFDRMDIKTAQERADKALQALEKKSKPTDEDKARLAKSAQLLDESCPLSREVGNCWELMGEGLKILDSKCGKDDQTVRVVLKTSKRLAAALDGGCSDCGSCGDGCTDCGGCEDGSGGCRSAKKADKKEAPKPKTQPPA
ncbi:MAG: hypothetical protein ACYSUN_05360 [Planctomycetota bacterium]|jgi:hypothetical protein